MAVMAGLVPAIHAVAQRDHNALKYKWMPARSAGMTDKNVQRLVLDTGRTR
jgi:hypothetical protein